MKTRNELYMDKAKDIMGDHFLDYKYAYEMTIKEPLPVQLENAFASGYMTALSKLGLLDPKTFEGLGD